MSQGFKLRFDQMRENSPAKTEIEQEPVFVRPDDTVHPIGHARNLCLVWPDGRRAFFNYAYLVSADFDPNNAMNVIRLGFSSQNVLLQGYGLEALFMQLLDHLPRIITAIDPRYLPVETGSGSIVVNIEVEVAE
ncbi:hypothetical protein MUK70_18980 [Dyadobacter chenwenxiniae]|uniref:Uncharacterized protein n=1 Tax=Dyadobacter chenwenxiniae TaxID=2906456 RepID=A0A9X1PJ65_9BACT|nr:hypothetical protein [Dyadobacter chenwenxiniae]MCF0061325.1 hypothetical protein [Dyadobacter chenwenxiniae]UON81147.1 hypothetical protein MUK70_18980 [Dyadobacter chenwenxiniae]